MFDLQEKDTIFTVCRLFADSTKNHVHFCLSDDNAPRKPSQLCWKAPKAGGPLLGSRRLWETAAHLASGPPGACNGVFFYMYSRVRARRRYRQPPASRARNPAAAVIVSAYPAKAMLKASGARQETSPAPVPARTDTAPPFTA